MISGRKAERSAGKFVPVLCACVLAVSSMLSVHAAPTSNFELDELMDKLAQVRASAGRFTERKYLSLLNEPLVLQGRVLYRAPDYVKKEYDDPNGESYEVQGDHLTIGFSDGRQRELSIDEHPVLRAFVESYRGTLAGDLETLKSYFEIELTGSLNDWKLHLIPLQEELAEYLSAVVMFGRGATIYSVETLQADGDRSVMTLDTPGG